MQFEPAFLLVMIGVLSIGCQLLATKIKLPAILPLLIAGIIVGPVSGILDSNALFGDLLFPFVSLAVAIILFEGALTLNFKELGAHGKVVTSLCSVGVLIGWLIVAPAAYFLFDLSWQMAFLFSGIVTVTGPTVIMPIIRAVRPNATVSRVLRWEGIIIDPVGAILAVLVFEFILSSQNAFLVTLFAFGKTLAAGTLIGIVFGFALGFVLKRNYIPAFLVNTLVFSTVLCAFQLANMSAHESGLITVTIMGLWLANDKDIDVESILEFKETLSVLLISGLFIILAARVDLNQLYSIAPAALVILAIMMLVSRPLGVFIATRGTDMKWQEKAMISWIAPRGIVAAAVSALFALKLQQQGYEGAEVIVSAVFFVIISTVLIQSLSATFVANLLGVREPAPIGFLIFGGNDFARQLALELMRNDIPVKVADTNWESISIARMKGIPTYFGNPSSEHASRTMETTGLGQVLVVSPYKYANSLVTHHFQHQFGSDKVHGLSVNETNSMSAHQPNTSYLKSLGLFCDATYSQLASAVSKNSEIKRTAITEEFTLDDYIEQYKGRFTPLFTLNAKGRARVVKNREDLEKEDVTHILSLIQPAEETESKKD